MVRMKTKVLKNDSLTQRNLVRHAMPRPSIRFVDKKKKQNKKACR